MSLINCKVGLKLTWKKYCILAATGNDKTNENPDNIISTIEDTKLHVPVVNFSAKNNKKLSKIFSKGFERSVF